MRIVSYTVRGNKPDVLEAIQKQTIKGVVFNMRNLLMFKVSEPRYGVVFCPEKHNDNEVTKSQIKRLKKATKEAGQKYITSGDELLSMITAGAEPNLDEKTDAGKLASIDLLDEQFSKFNKIDIKQDGEPRKAALERAIKESGVEASTDEVLELWRLTKDSIK